MVWLAAFLRCGRFIVTVTMPSFEVAVMASAVSLSIGLVYGLISGYFGGAVDNLMMRIVDVLYETVREGVTGSRNISAAAFDRTIDEATILSPQEALELGLVDAISRWDQLSKNLKAEDAGVWPLPPVDTYREFWDEQWGEPKKIPVVYAVGPCAKDGIVV